MTVEGVGGPTCFASSLSTFQSSDLLALQVAGICLVHLVFATRAVYQLKSLYHFSSRRRSNTLGTSAAFSKVGATTAAAAEQPRGDQFKRGTLHELQVSVAVLWLAAVSALVLYLIERPSLTATSPAGSDVFSLGIFLIVVVSSVLICVYTLYMPFSLSRQHILNATHNPGKSEPFFFLHACLHGTGWPRLEIETCKGTERSKIYIDMIGEKAGGTGGGYEDASSRVPLWACLADPLLIRRFLEFLQTEFCPEILLFWIRVGPFVCSSVFGQFVFCFGWSVALTLRLCDVWPDCGRASCAHLAVFENASQKSLSFSFFCCPFLLFFLHAYIGRAVG